MSGGARAGTRRGQATLREVADRAGVSQMTVSRVLNTPDLVRHETRARVHEAMDALSYRPNLMARSLAGGSSLFLGLVCDNPSNSYLAELLIGALGACRGAGHHLVIEEVTDAEAGDPQGVARRLRQGGLDGVVLAAPRSDDPELAEALRRLGVPFVLISPGHAAAGSLSVAIDDEVGARAVTRHLIEAGHRRIGFIQGPSGQTASAARRRGYEAALAEAGVAADGSLVAGGDFTYESGVKAAETLMDLASRPTAMFASNDDMAAGAIAAAGRRGLRVPDDLSVAGFDDTQVARTIFPALTTIHQPIREMAVEAVAMLAEACAAAVPPAPRRHLADVRLVARESVGRPAS